MAASTTAEVSMATTHCWYFELWTTNGSSGATSVMINKDCSRTVISGLARSLSRSMPAAATWTGRGSMETPVVSIAAAAADQHLHKLLSVEHRGHITTPTRAGHCCQPRLSMPCCMPHLDRLTRNGVKCR